MKDNFIEVEISKEMYENAKKIADAQGALKGSIRFGKGNLTGYLGEEIFYKLFPKAERINDYESDFALNGYKIEVKSKQCSSKPLEHYEGSVTYSKKPQDCDIYFFTRIHKDTRTGWYCGWRTHDSFLRDALVLRKGDTDPKNNYVCKRDCWNMKYNDMNDIDSLKLYVEDNKEGERL